MTVGSAHIRLANPGDGAAIARIQVETWREAYAGIVPDDYLVGMEETVQAAGWRKLLLRRASAERTLVAEVPVEAAVGEHSLIGFGSCGPQRSSTLLYSGEVYTLYVLPDWQGEGIGRQLLYAMFRRLYERGVPDCVVWVLADNPARFFYERMGGQNVAERSESFAGERLAQRAYAWPDLEAWLAQMGG